MNYSKLSPEAQIVRTTLLDKFDGDYHKTISLFPELNSYEEAVACIKEFIHDCKEICPDVKISPDSNFDKPPNYFYSVFATFKKLNLNAVLQIPAQLLPGKEEVVSVPTKKFSYDLSEVLKAIGNE